MKLEIIAVAILATALITPTFAEEKSATKTPKAVALKAQKTTPSKRHSHLEDRHGIKSTDQSASDSKPVDKSKHSHPKDR